MFIQLPGGEYMGHRKGKRSSGNIQEDGCDCGIETESIGMLRFDDNGNLISLSSNIQNQTKADSDECDCQSKSRRASRQHKTRKRRARCRSGAFTAVR